MWLRLQACVELLKPTGGKLHAFVSSLPNSGIKALKMRDSSSSMAEKEKQMGLLPQDATYLSLAAQAADFQVRALAQPLRLCAWSRCAVLMRDAVACSALAAQCTHIAGFDCLLCRPYITPSTVLMIPTQQNKACVTGMRKASMRIVVLRAGPTSHLLCAHRFSAHDTSWLRSPPC